MDGNSLLTPVLQAGYPTYQREFGLDKQKVYVYAIASSVAKNFIPSDSDHDPDGEEGYRFSKATISPAEPGISLLTVTYSPIDNLSTYTNTKHSVGDIIKSSSISVTEKPIETHPNYSAGSTSAFMTYIQANKITSYASASPQYTYTQVYDKNSIAFTESLITAGVNTQGVPTGLIGANATKWVKIGRDVESDGTTLTIRDTYAYDAQGWKGVNFGLNNVT